MAIIISHYSALEFYRARPPQVWKCPRTTQPVPLPEASASAAELQGFDASAFGLRNTPVHYLIARGLTRSNNPGFQPHSVSFAEFPAESLVQIAPNVYATSPELTFIQLAREVSGLGLIALGYELCGSYAHFPQLISGFYDRRPLTSVARISALANDVQGTHGIVKAREALRWVRDGSRSPMETVVSCMLYLPESYGGWSFAAPNLNHRIKLDAASSRIAKAKTCVIDVAWPESKVGVEYDGEAYHLDGEKDRLRREALAHHGWDIYVFRLDEIRSYQQLEDKVNLFAERIPVQQKTKSAPIAKRRELLGKLLKITRFGLGLDVALFGTRMPKGKVVTHL